MAVTPASVWIPTQRSLVPSFISVVGYTENFSPCPYAAADVHGGMDQISFTIVWRRHQVLSGSLPYSRLSPVLHQLLTRPRTFHLAFVEAVHMEAMARIEL